MTGAPWAQQLTPDQMRGMTDAQVGGQIPIVRNDPAFQPPSDPLKAGDAGKRARLVYRDIPLTSVVLGVGPGAWTPPAVYAALQGHSIGVFDASAQLADAILGDPRIQATVNSKQSALFGQEQVFQPANDSRAAREVLDAWVGHWPQLANGSQIREIDTYEIIMGWCPAQVTWDTSGERWLPYLRFFHPRYTYYHWNLRRYIALTLDGQIPIYPGDAKWLLHASHGEYRGWMYGAIRGVAEPWLLRHWAFRDMARFSERYGTPILKLKVPAAAAEDQRDRFQADMTSIAGSTTVMVPQGVDPSQNYDLELVEATAQAWQIFPGLVDRCDMDIVLAILMQNLTTEVSGGSFAATKSHMEILQHGTEIANQAWKLTIRNQMARPFAAFNFGDASLAPWTSWDVKARGDYDGNASRFYSFGQALQILRQGGVKFPDETKLRDFAKDQFGLELPKVEITEPDSGSGGGDKADAKKPAPKEK